MFCYSALKCSAAGASLKSLQASVTQSFYIRQCTRSYPQSERILSKSCLISTRGILEVEQKIISVVTYLTCSFIDLCLRIIILILLVVFFFFFFYLLHFVFIDFLQHKGILDVCNICIQHLPLKMVKS